MIVLLMLLYYIYYYWHHTSSVNKDISTDDIIPTLHAKCNEIGCGGELVCDRISHRCRQPLGGQCANTIDCVHGLYCNNWICSADNLSDSVDMISTPVTTKSHIVKWADDLNQTRYYNVRN